MEPCALAILPMPSLWSRPRGLLHRCHARPHQRGLRAFHGALQGLAADKGVRQSIGKITNLVHETISNGLVHATLQDVSTTKANKHHYNFFMQQE